MDSLRSGPILLCTIVVCFRIHQAMGYYFEWLDSQETISQCVGDDAEFHWQHNSSAAISDRYFVNARTDKTVVTYYADTNSVKEYDPYKGRTAVLKTTQNETVVKLKDVQKLDNEQFRIELAGPRNARSVTRLRVFNESDLRPIIRINTNDVFPGESRVNLTDRNVTIFITPHKDLKANIVITTCAENKSMLCHKNYIYISPEIVENECIASIYVDYGICDVFTFFVLMDLPLIVYPSNFAASSWGLAIGFTSSILFIVIVIVLFYKYRHHIVKKPCCSKVVTTDEENESPSRPDVKFQVLVETDEQSISRKTDITASPKQSNPEHSDEAVPDSILKISKPEDTSINVISIEQPPNTLPKISTELSTLLTKDGTNTQDLTLKTHTSAHSVPETSQLSMPNDERLSEEDLHQSDSDKSDVRDNPTPSPQTVVSRPVFKKERQSKAKKNIGPKRKTRSKSDVPDENEPKTHQEYLQLLNPITPDSKPKNITNYRDPVQKDDDNDATDTGNNKDLSLLETADNQPVPDVDELAELLDGTLKMGNDNNKEETRKEKAPVLQPATLSAGLNPIFAGQQHQETNDIIDDDEQMAEAGNDSSVHQYPPSVADNVPVSTIGHYPQNTDKPEDGLFV